jgi:hypothetical protein
MGNGVTNSRPAARRRWQFVSAPRQFVFASGGSYPFSDASYPPAETFRLTYKMINGNIY